MRKILLLTAFLSIISILNAQDRITTLSGKVYNCTILKVDTSRIELTTRVGTRMVNTHISMKEVISYTYLGRQYYPNRDSTNNKNLLDKSSVYNFADSIEKQHPFFLFTFSGEVIPANNIKYKTPFLGNKHFLADSRKIEAENIKFYKNESGFYGITYAGTSFNYTERIRKGKINLYEAITRNSYPGTYRMGGAGMPGSFSPGFSTVTIKNYYNIGFGDLKKATYQNLSVDLSDNPTSMMHLNQIKKVSNTQTFLGIAGGIIIIAGAAALISKTSDIEENGDAPLPNTTPQAITVCIGTGMIWAAYFMSFSKPKHLRKAIDAYNQ